MFGNSVFDYSRFYTKISDIPKISVDGNRKYSPPEYREDGREQRGDLEDPRTEDYLFVRASRGTKYARVGEKNALFSGDQHFAHCPDLAFECVAIIIFTPFVEGRISSMAAPRPTENGTETNVERKHVSDHEV